MVKMIAEKTLKIFGVKYCARINVVISYVFITFVVNSKIAKPYLIFMLSDKSDKISIKFLQLIIFFCSLYVSHLIFRSDLSAQNSLPATIISGKTDTIKRDSLAVAPLDSIDLKGLKTATDNFDAPVNYKARDSIVYDLTNEKAFIYGQGEVTQKDVNLKAGFIDLNNKTKLVAAIGRADSSGSIIEKPIFSQGEQVFNATELSYNFKTKKGRINDVVTQQGDGFLHGEQVKKSPDNEFYAYHNYYTTCNLEEPHFHIALKKVKVVPNELIVSGPAQLTIQNVPTPLVLPFGIFPIQKGQRSGIVLPSWGFSPTQGYYFRNGGIYLGFGRLADFELTSDIYTRGTWRLNLLSRYVRRYRFNGNFNIGYGMAKNGDPITPDFTKSKNFEVSWQHNQDQKAHPYRRFSANVRFLSNNYTRTYEVSNQDVLTNTYNSSISFNYTFPHSPFSFTAQANHDQNTNTRIATLTLPRLTLNMRSINPFKRKIQVGKQRWYEKIALNYNNNALAKIVAADSLLLTKQALEYLEAGMAHQASLRTDFKLFKYFNLAPSFNYTENWYPQSTRKVFIADTTYETITTTTGETKTDTILPHLKTIKDKGFASTRYFSASTSLSTRIYGSFLFKRGRIAGIRHEVNPSVGFSYSPNFADPFWGYYQQIEDENGQYISGQNEEVYKYLNLDTNYRYSIFEGMPFGGPGSGKSGTISFSIGNNLQMKMRPKIDTTEIKKKINLIDQFSVASGYNLAADSLNWQMINLSARTNLFNGAVSIIWSASYDPYIINSNGRRLNTLVWNDSKKLARFNGTNLTINTTLRPKNKQTTASQPQTQAQAQANSSGARRGEGLLQPSTTPNTTDNRINEEEAEAIGLNPENYVNWEIPWNLSAGYTLNVQPQTSNGITKNQITQTIALNGDINLTYKWKIGFSTGYDLTNKDISRTSIDIYRDLHCWEILFTIAPFGQYKRYDFTLRAKSPTLQDLKLSRKRNWRDF